MKPDALIKTIRQMCNDDRASSQSWSDDQYITAINEARRLIFDAHPEARIDATGALLSYTEVAPSDISTTMTFPDDHYTEPVVNFVLYRYYLSEGGDVRDNSRAGAYLQRYNAFFGRE